MPGIETLTTVLCEEVRKEASGQATIVGALNRGPYIAANGDTQLGRLGIYIEAKLVDVERIRFRLRNSASAQIVLESEFSFSLKDELHNLPEGVDLSEIEVNTQFVINKESVTLSGAGDYILEAQVVEGDWEYMRSWEFPPESDD